MGLRKIMRWFKVHSCPYPFLKGKQFPAQKNEAKKHIGLGN